MSIDVIPWDADDRHALHALVRKRGEIAGQIERDQTTLRRLIVELEHIDAAIHVFNPAVNVGAIKSKAPRHVAFKGEITRLVFKMLRASGGSAISRDIALQLMSERGLNPNDRDLYVIMIKRVRACLRAQRRKGVIRNVTRADGASAWELVR